MKLKDRINRSLYKAVSKGMSLNISKPNKNNIIAKVIGEARDLSRKDIQTWREALEGALDIDSPRYADYHDLLDNLSTDGHLQSQIQIRKLATLSSSYNIIDIKTGKEIPEKTEMLKTSWFYDFVNNVLDSVFRGYEVLELVDTGKLCFEVIPRRNIVPQKKLMLFEATGDKGINYDDPLVAKYIIEVGEVGNLGILNNIVPQLIWKKNAQQSWAEFAEKFGMPLVVAKTNKSDTKSLDKIEDQVSSMGEAGTAVLPEGTSLDIIASAAADSFNVYDKQIERTNSEISKQILGGTMVSDNGSARSQAEVHERTLDNKIAEADRHFVEFLINDKLIPLLRGHGYQFSDTDKFVFDRSRSIPIKDHWAIVKEALNEYDIPDEWISKTFKIPINGRKEKTTNFNKPLSEGSKTEANNGFNFPTYAIGEFTAMASSREIQKKITDLQEKINEKIFKKENCSEEILKKAIVAGRWLRTGLFKGWGKRRLSIDYNATDNNALAYMEYNLFHFSYARELAGLEKLNQLIIDKDKLEIRTFSDFVKKAEPFTTQLNRTWLETEYQFAIAVGQNASSYNKCLSEKDTVTRYMKYQTVGDSAVRDSHAILDGKVFLIDDPEARRLWPPNGWKCRCEFVQYLNDKPKDLMSGKEAFEILGEDIETIKKRGGNEQFYINRSDIGQVFTRNQFYIKDYNYGDSTNKLSYKDYSLKPFDKLKNGKKTLVLDKTITKDNVKELFKVKGTKNKGKENVNVMAFKDYLNRNIILSEKEFKKHTTGYYLGERELRHQIFPHVKDVLSNPDEVYFSEYKKKKYQVRYIKFYKDEIICVDSIVKNNNIEIATWYSGKTGDNVRKGLMIK